MCKAPRPGIKRHAQLVWECMICAAGDGRPTHWALNGDRLCDSCTRWASREQRVGAVALWPRGADSPRDHVTEARLWADRTTGWAEETRRARPIYVSAAEVSAAQMMHLAGRFPWDRPNYVPEDAEPICPPE